MPHLHCQTCGAHYENRAELDHHHRHAHKMQAESGQRGELPPDANAGIQERPAGRKNREFTRSPKE